MRPKAQGLHDEGFLEYLEDIIGTNKYVEKIDESSKEWVLFLFLYLSYVLILHFIHYHIWNFTLHVLSVKPKWTCRQGIFLTSTSIPNFYKHSYWLHRLESLNEKRSGVVQMVKMAEKERDSLEVGFLCLFLSYHFQTCLTNLLFSFHEIGCEEWSRGLHASRVIITEMARESHKIGSWRY